MKRFWDEAAVIAEGAGFGVTLDGKALRVPEGGVLTVPTRALGSAIAAEWQAAGGGKGGEMSYADLPLTRLAGTAQERIARDPEPVVLELARYAESDLLCYRAEHPRPLVERQQAQWQPWLDWTETRFAAPLRVTAGIIHVPQPSASLAALAQAVAAFDPYRLAGLGILVPSYGSLVLALAVAHGALTAVSAFELATLDERFQVEQWGWDQEAEERMRKVEDDVTQAGRFIALCAA